MAKNTSVKQVRIAIPTDIHAHLKGAAAIAQKKLPEIIIEILRKAVGK
jgi:predicted HicB family RNase H-like nuclease